MTSQPTGPVPSRPAVLIDSPARSLIWIAFWFSLGLVTGTLALIVGPSSLFSSSQSYTDQKGAFFIATMPIVSLVVIVMFGLVFLFVVLEFATSTVDLSVIVVDMVGLLVVGIPAAGTLSVALRRRAAHRRVAAQR